MRIGIDARMYGPEATTGIGAYIKNLTDQLFFLDQKNEYFLFMREPAYSRFVCPRPGIKKIKADFPWYSFSEQLKMPLVLLKYRLDLVHFPHFNAAIFYPKKFVITIHDITPKFFPGPKAKKSLIRRFGYEAVFRLSLWRAKKIIAISRYTKENLIKYFKAPEKSIAVIYPGVDANCREIFDQNQMAAFKEKYGIVKPFIFYVGVWRDHKNLPALIKAFEILKSKLKTDCQLVLGGQDDSRYPEIGEALAASPFKSEIIAPGFIPEKDLPLFYAAAALFVLPSFCEGFGLVALEAMACGCPVIGSKTTSLPEILGQAALYFNPQKPEEIAALARRILTDPALAEDLKTRGLARAKQYNWQDCAKKVLALYQSL